ncbi:MAG: protease modulator HflK [Kiritimatiellaeota bacterium]|nr:protease modulator HflK [Kiritimatiellota bacterium]
MDKRNEKLAWLGAAVAVAGLLLNLLLATRTGLLALPTLLPIHALALAVALLVAARLRLLRLAGEEQRDVALARREAPDAGLFAAETEAGAFTQARSRNEFERWLLPWFAPALAVGLGLWAYLLARRLSALAGMPTQPLLAAAFLAGESFILFLVSRFLIGLSRETPARLLRGIGAYLGLAGLANLPVLAAALAAEAEFTAADRGVALGLVGLILVLVVELFFRTIAALYRRARPGTPATVYESRLAGLLTDPSAWTHSVASALDYQFGFQVSETWLYRFLRRALLPLALLNLLVLYACTCVVFLGPEEEGILERFGRPRPDAWQLASGAHLKWPWPFETVRRFPARRIHTFSVGFVAEPQAQPPTLILWTMPHYREEDAFLVANQAESAAATGAVAEAAVPVNLVSVNLPVEYQITNLFQYAYRHAEPDRLIEQLAYRSVTLELAGRDLFAVLGAGQEQTTRALLTRLQGETDRHQLGVQVLFVGLAGVHPPVGVADAFESVVGAVEEKEASLLNAQAHRNRTLPAAAAQAARIQMESVAYRTRRMEIARAEANQFTQRLAANDRSPAVFRARLYLDTLGGALTGIRKYIIATAGAREVLTFNLEEKPNLDWMDLGAKPEEKAKKK